MFKCLSVLNKSIIIDHCFKKTFKDALSFFVRHTIRFILVDQILLCVFFLAHVCTGKTLDITRYETKSISSRGTLTSEYKSRAFVTSQT